MKFEEAVNAWIADISDWYGYEGVSLEKGIEAFENEFVSDEPCFPEDGDGKTYIEVFINPDGNDRDSDKWTSGLDTADRERFADAVDSIYRKPGYRTKNDLIMRFDEAFCGDKDDMLDYLISRLSFSALEEIVRIKG